MSKYKGPYPVSTREGINWRGSKVVFMLEGQAREGTVITHIRNDHWKIRIESPPPGIEHAIILHRTDFDILPSREEAPDG